MKSTNVLHNQNMFDIAVEKQGDVRSAFDLAMSNCLSVTDTLVSGLNLAVTDSEYKNIDITDYYYRRNQQVATDNLSNVNQYIFSQTLPFIL